MSSFCVTDTSPTEKTSSWNEGENSHPLSYYSHPVFLLRYQQIRRFNTGPSYSEPSSCCSEALLSHRCSPVCCSQSCISTFSERKGQVKNKKKIISLQNFPVWKSLGKTCLQSDWMPLEDGDWIRMPSILFGQYPLAIFHYCLSYYQLSRCASFLLIQPSELPCYRENNHFSQAQTGRKKTLVSVLVSDVVDVHAAETQDQFVQNKSFLVSTVS